MRSKLLNLALAVTLSSAALIANAAPTYTFSILESEPDWGTPNLETYRNQLNRPAGYSNQANDINNSGAIAGNVMGQFFFAAFWASYSSPYTKLWALGGEAKEGQAFAINDSGDVAGYSQNANNVYQATLWTSANYNSPTYLQSLGGADKPGEAWAINNSGQSVGISFDTFSTYYYLVANETSRATLWNGTNPPIDLNDYLDQASKNAGWSLNDAYRIDNDGSIFGEAFNRNSNVWSFFSLQSVNPVPEADTSAMLLMGAGVMGFMARRRKNTQA